MPELVTEQRFSASGIGSSGRNALDTTVHLLAVQGQLLRGAELALRARGALSSPAELHALINSGELVLSWLNRSTLHLVTRADYWPLLNATGAGSLQRVGARFKSVGLSPFDISRALDAQREALAGGDAVAKAVLASALRQALPGHELSSVTLASLIEYAAASGILVRGPLDGTDPLYVDAERWLGERPATDPESLSRLASRYATAHAHAEADDFAYWLGIGKREARAAWIAQTAPVAQTTWSGLLGPFDPLLHGWPDRSWILGAYADRVVSTNGVFRPSIIVNNLCVGIWSSRAGEVELEWFEQPGRAERVAIEDDLERVREFTA